MAPTFAMHFGLDIVEKLRIPCCIFKMCPDLPTRHAPPFGEAPSAAWLPGFVRGWAHLSRHYLRLIRAALAASRSGFTELQNEFRARVLGLDAVTGARLREIGHTPTLMVYSSTALPKPRDWPSWYVSKSVDRYIARCVVSVFTS